MYRLNLVTPEKCIEPGTEVTEVTVPAYKGELDILEGHAPTLTTLDTGVMTYKLAATGEVKKAVITWGFARVGDGQIEVLAETAESASQINKERCKEAEKTALAKLDSGELDADGVQKYQMKLKRAQARLSI